MRFSETENHYSLELLKEKGPYSMGFVRLRRHPGAGPVAALCLAFYPTQLKSDELRFRTLESELTVKDPTAASARGSP